MTANDPSRQQEAVNHGDAENSQDTAIVRTRNQGSVDFDVFDQRERALLYKFEERAQGRSDNSVVLRVSSQLFALGAILPTFHLDTSNDRPNSGAVAQTLPVWTSALVEARSRRWFRCPPLCKRACTRATSRPSSSTLFDSATFFRQEHQLWRRAPDHRPLARSRSQRSLGVWRRCQNSSHLGTLHRPSWDLVRDRLSHQYRLTTTASVIHPRTSIQSAPEKAYKMSLEHRNHATSSC